MHDRLDCPSSRFLVIARIVTFLLLAQKKSNQKKKAPRALRSGHPLRLAAAPAGHRTCSRFAPLCSWTPARQDTSPCYHIGSKTHTDTKELAGWPEKNAGVRWQGGGKHVFFLIFFGSFLDQAKKEHSVRCIIKQHLVVSVMPGVHGLGQTCQISLSTRLKLPPRIPRIWSLVYLRLMRASVRSNIRCG